MLISDSIDTLHAVHHDVDFTTEKYSLRVYVPKTNVILYIVTQGATGDWNTASQAVFLVFKDDGKIWYYDGTWVDTGQSYTTGWHLIEIVHDFPNDQFDAWYDGTKIVSAGGFRTSQSSGKNLQIGCDPQSSGSTDWWFDDVQVGESSGIVILRRRMEGD